LLEISGGDYAQNNNPKIDYIWFKICYVKTTSTIIIYSSFFFWTDI